MATVTREQLQKALSSLSALEGMASGYCELQDGFDTSKGIAENVRQLLAALASPPAEDVPTHADWSVVDCQPDQNDVPPNEYRPVIVPVNGLGYTSVILRDCSITESLPSKSGAIVLRDSHRGDVVGLRFPGTFAQAPPASDPPGLPRYGVTWQEGVSSPLLTPMADGYWTPWHLAAQAIAARQSDPPGLVANWRPIETAPKRTDVLAGWADRPHWLPQVLQQDDAGMWFNGEESDYRPPTHWMPLPASPQAKED